MAQRLQHQPPDGVGAALNPAVKPAAGEGVCHSLHALDIKAT